MIATSVAELIELFDEEGTFIFVERRGCERPKFHVENAAAIKRAGHHFPTSPNDGALIAPDLLYDMPAMLADMVRSLANDISVSIVYAYTEQLARHLVTEAEKQDNTPFLSGQGQLMDVLTRYAGGSSGGGNQT